MDVYTRNKAIQQHKIDMMRDVFFILFFSKKNVPLLQLLYSCVLCEYNSAYK